MATNRRASYEFRTAPEGNTAWGFPRSPTAPAVFLEEWAGRSLEEFEKRLGRPADWATYHNWNGRKVNFYYWR